MDENEERDLQEVVSHLPTEYLDCRLNHRWKRQGKPMEEPGGTWLIRFRCTGCKAKRFDRVTRGGTRYARWYERPDGYDIKGFGHATRRKAPYMRELIDRYGDGA